MPARSMAAARSRRLPARCGAAVAVAAVVVGTGAGTGGHCTSERFPLRRVGTAPVSRYATILSSVHATPDSEPACVVPPTPSISDAVGKIDRTYRLPA